MDPYQFSLFSKDHTSSPPTHVPLTYPLESRITKSASAPGRSVPLRCSILRQLEVNEKESTSTRAKKKPGTYAAGLYVTHFRASPSVHPVNWTKLRTQMSNVTTLKRRHYQTSNTKTISVNLPSCECISPFNVKFYAIFDQPSVIPPIVQTVLQVWIKHGHC